MARTGEHKTKNRNVATVPGTPTPTTTELVRVALPASGSPEQSVSGDATMHVLVRLRGPVPDGYLRVIPDGDYGWFVKYKWTGGRAEGYYVFDSDPRGDLLAALRRLLCKVEGVRMGAFRATRDKAVEPR